MQTVFRGQPQSHFMLVDNSFWSIKDLGDAALVLLGRLLSMPDNWEFHYRWIEAEWDYSQSRLQRLMRELKKHRYVVHTKKHIKGRWTWTLKVYRHPISPELSAPDPIGKDSIAEREPSAQEPVSSICNTSVPKITSCGGANLPIPIQPKHKQTHTVSLSSPIGAVPIMVRAGMLPERQAAAWQAARRVAPNDLAFIQAIKAAHKHGRLEPRYTVGILKNCMEQCQGPDPTDTKSTVSLWLADYALCVNWDSGKLEGIVCHAG